MIRFFGFGLVLVAILLPRIVHDYTIRLLASGQISLFNLVTGLDAGLLIAGFVLMLLGGKKRNENIHGPKQP